MNVIDSSFCSTEFMYISESTFPSYPSCLSSSTLPILVLRLDNGSEPVSDSTVITKTNSPIKLFLSFKRS